MGGRYKRNEPKEEPSDRAGLPPLPGDTAAGMAEPHTPVPGVTAEDEGGGQKGRTACSDSLTSSDTVQTQCQSLCPGFKVL